MAGRAAAPARHHAPGTCRLRVRNLPAVYARDAPTYEQLMVQLLWEHSHVATFEPRHWRKWTNRDRTHAWGFVEVPSMTDREVLIQRAHHVVVNGVAWQAEWTHDSLPALLAMLDRVTNPDYPQLSFFLPR